MGFKAPSASNQFCAAVIGRVHDLVNIGVWDIDQTKLTGWIDQFRSADEIYFAACLLDSLMYRSDDQFSACFKNLFRGALRWSCGRKIKGSTDLDLVNALRSLSDPGVRLVPVIRNDDPPTKSGPLVLRYVKRALGLNVDWMIWPWQVGQLLSRRRPKIHTIIFVDDFLGSGTQFNDFVSTQQLQLTNKAVQWIREVRGCGKFGNQLHGMALTLGAVFRVKQQAVTQSEPEINHFYITAGDIDSDLEAYLHEAEKWSVLFEEHQTKLKAVGAKTSQYVLNPVFAAHFQVSFRKKKSIPIIATDLKTMFTGDVRERDAIVRICCYGSCITSDRRI